jgi:hypothetical protein
METLETYGKFAERAGLKPTELTDISEQTLPTFSHWHSRLERSRDEVRGLIGEDGLSHFLASCEILPALWEQRILGYGLMVARKE